MLSSSYQERRGGAEEREVGVCPGEACKVKKDGSQYSNTNSQVPQPTFWGEPDSHAVCRMIFSFPVEFEDGHTD